MGDVIMAIITKKKGWISWGFDLTDFGEDEKVFVALLKRHKLASYRKVPTDYNTDKNYYHFVWSNPKLILTTSNNPITGEYTGGDAQRKREKGYASYIGIDGEEKLVKALAKDIRTVGNINCW
jgi:hypothetical protein